MPGIARAHASRQQAGGLGSRKLLHSTTFQPPRLGLGGVASKVVVNESGVQRLPAREALRRARCSKGAALSRRQSMRAAWSCTRFPGPLWGKDAGLRERARERGRGRMRLGSPCASACSGAVLGGGMSCRRQPGKAANRPARPVNGVVWRSSRLENGVARPQCRPGPKPQIQEISYGVDLLTSQSFEANQFDVAHKSIQNNEESAKISDLQGH